MDRTSVVTEFRSIIWTCPKCGQEDVEYMPIGGGGSHEHDCSACGQHFNGPIGRPGRLVYHGTVKTDPTEYAALDAKAVTERKRVRVTEWLAGVKNPPKAIEPTAADLEREKEDLDRRAMELTERIKLASDYQPPTPEKLRERRQKLVDDLDKLDLEIAQRPELPTVVEELDQEVERLGQKQGRVKDVADRVRGNQ